MKKVLYSAIFGLTTLHAINAHAADTGDLGMAVNYGLISGPALELTYPINDLFQVRGALSAGMGLSENTDDTDIVYDVEADGGIHRLSMDYHPFAGTFFMSAGYAFNDFKLKADGTGTDVEVGNEPINGTVNINGAIEWDSAPMLSLGWGHSPAEGWGAMFEIGAIFTGEGDVSLAGTVTGDGASSQDELNAALKEEEVILQNDVGDFDFLPILQAGITYRF